MKASPDGYGQFRDDDGDPWFILADVCRVLEISNPSMAASRLDEDERAKVSLGRQGNANVVNESGLYTLILRSDKPAAKRFRKWVTADVLPAILKLISDNEEAKLAWDRAVRGERGGAHNPLGLGGKSGKTAVDIVKSDNVRLDKEPDTKMDIGYGNSSQAGLRRLDKAAQGGDEKAASLLRRVVAEEVSVHAARFVEKTTDKSHIPTPVRRFRCRSILSCALNLSRA